MNLSKINEIQFADAVKRYTLRNYNNSLKDGQNGRIPENWILHLESDDPLDYDITFRDGKDRDEKFRRFFGVENIVSNLWKKFDKEFFTPEFQFAVSLRDHVESLSKGKISPFTWNPEEKRYFEPEFINLDSENFLEIALEELRKSGKITESSDQYELPTFGLRVGERIVDLPLDYYRLHQAIRYAETHDIGYNFSTEFEGKVPPEIIKYDGRKPSVSIIGNTIKHSYGEFPEVLELIEKKTRPRPRFQSLVYILSEEVPNENESFDINPKYIVHQKAEVSSQNGRKPIGKVLVRETYRVPLNMRSGELGIDSRVSDSRNMSMYERTHKEWGKFIKDMLVFHPYLKTDMGKVMKQ